MKGTAAVEAMEGEEKGTAKSPSRGGDDAH
jgi:hypothetical protein